MFYGIFSALFVGGIVGVLAEKFGFARNGYIVSAALGIGGAMILTLGPFLLGFNLGYSRGVTSAVGAVALLVLASRRR